MTTLVFDAGPAPHIFIVTVISRNLENTGCEGPHDRVEDEEANSEQRVVNGCLLSSAMATAPVRIENSEGEGKRNTGDGEADILWPSRSAYSPGGKTIAGRERFGCIEDSKGRGKHGEDDKTASKIDASEEKLGYSDSGFNFLERR